MPEAAGSFPEPGAPVAVIVPASRHAFVAGLASGLDRDSLDRSLHAAAAEAGKITPDMVRAADDTFDPSGSLYRVVIHGGPVPGPATARRGTAWVHVDDLIAAALDADQAATGESIGRDLLWQFLDELTSMPGVDELAAWDFTDVWELWLNTGANEVCGDIGRLAGGGSGRRRRRRLRLHIRRPGGRTGDTVNIRTASADHHGAAGRKADSHSVTGPRTTQPHQCPDQWPRSPVPGRHSLGECHPASQQPGGLKNSWGTGDGRHSVIVDAGASTADPSDGIFIILRQHGGRQSLDTITVPGTGAVWISSAPLGVSVETSAQTGDLSFDSDNGITGTLHLSDETVTENSGMP